MASTSKIANPPQSNLTDESHTLPNYEYRPLQDPVLLERKTGLFKRLARQLVYRLAPRAEPSHRTVRLLTLLPGDAEDEIRCVLLQVDLYDQPKYEALSYVWGDPKSTQNIVCDGRRIAIKSNLFSALHNLRESGRARVLWVDALCINQGDLDERAAQVQIMGRIYSNASRTLVWLGEESEHDSEVFEAIKMINDKASVYWEAFGMTTDLRQQEEVFARLFKTKILEENLLSKQTYSRILRLYSRPWFTRLWVIQEVVRGKNVIAICGSRTLEWHLLSRAASMLSSNTFNLIEMIDSEDPQNGLRGIQNTMAIDRRRLLPEMAIRFPQTVAFLIGWMTFSCTDPRDRIFALLDLITPYGEERDESLMPNYRIDTHELYRKYTMYSFGKGSLDHLLIAGIREDGLTVSRDLPSWVPDWNGELTGTSLIISLLVEKASGPSRPDLSYSEDEKVLRVRGKALDRVYRVAERAFESPSIMTDGLVWLQQWLQIAGTPETDLTGFLVSEASDAFLRAVMFNYQVMKREPPCERDVDEIRVILSKLLQASGKAKLGTTVSPFEDKVRLEQSIFWSGSQHFCKTQKDRLGWIAPIAQEGDIIAIMYGANCPLVLRPIAYKDAYLVVGNCWIDGLMDGAAFASSDTEDQIFDIH